MTKTFFYKGVRVNVFGIPVGDGKKSRIKTRNRIRRSYYLTFNSPFSKKDPKNLIVIYDIPEKLKKERDWFRRQLISFGYEMIQRSVWVGPSPLPKEFKAYLKLLGLRNKLQTFKLAKPYSKRKTF